MLSYLLTPWCRVLLEQLADLQLVKKFLAFHGTRRFITALTSIRHLSLSWASPIQSIYPHPTSWRSILILSTHLRLGLPSGLFLSGFPTKTLYTPLSSPSALYRTKNWIGIFCGSSTWECEIWKEKYTNGNLFEVNISSYLMGYILLCLCNIQRQIVLCPSNKTASLYIETLACFGPEWPSSGHR